MPAIPWGCVADLGMLDTYMRAPQRAEPQHVDAAEEKALVDRSKAGDKRALTRLLGLHAPQLLRAVLLPRMGNLASAEDVLNESLLKACQNLHRFTWQESGFYPWLRTICVNTALDHLRKRKRLVLFDSSDIEKRSDETQTAAVPAEVEEHELTLLRARLEAQLAELNPRYANVIRARLVEGRSREAVATELGVTVATFDVLFHRAMKALKALVVKTEENETP